MTLHDLFTLLILLIRTSGYDMTQLHYIYFSGINIGVQYIRYTSEYILNLQLRQHSFLTRKFFSRHNFHHWSSSLYLLVICISKSSCLQVIFIFMPSSFLDLDHHSIWIIITGSGSSLDLDHHCWIIITGSSSWVLSHDSSHHKKFYRSNPFSC